MRRGLSSISSAIGEEFSKISEGMMEDLGFGSTPKPPRRIYPWEGPRFDAQPHERPKIEVKKIKVKVLNNEKSGQEAPTYPYKDPEGLDPKLVFDRTFSMKNHVRHCCYLETSGILVMSNNTKYHYRTEISSSLWLERFGLFDREEFTNDMIQHVPSFVPDYCFVLRKNKLFHTSVIENTNDELILEASDMKKECICGCDEPSCQFGHQNEFLRIISDTERNRVHVLCLKVVKVNEPQRQFGKIEPVYPLCAYFYIKTVYFGHPKRSISSPPPTMSSDRFLRNVQLEFEIKRKQSSKFTRDTLPALKQDTIFVSSAASSKIFYIRAWDSVNRVIISSACDYGNQVDTLMQNYDPNEDQNRRISEDDRIRMSMGMMRENHIYRNKKIVTLNIFRDMCGGDTVVIGYIPKDTSTSVFGFFECKDLAPPVKVPQEIELVDQEVTCAEMFTCEGRYSRRRYLIVGCESGDVVVFQLDYIQNPREKVYKVTKIATKQAFPPRPPPRPCDYIPMTWPCASPSSVDGIVFLCHSKVNKGKGSNELLFVQ